MQDGWQPPQEVLLTIDKLRDTTEEDLKTKKFTAHPPYKRHQEGLKTRFTVLSSQTIGWRPPLDRPDLGFGRKGLTFC